MIAGRSSPGSIRSGPICTTEMARRSMVIPKRARASVCTSRTTCLGALSGEASTCTSRMPSLPPATRTAFTDGRRASVSSSSCMSTVFDSPTWTAATPRHHHIA